MKKKKKVEAIEFEEKFTIPQISYTLDGLIKGKTKFQRSEIVSPFHGTNVVDRMHYVDNSGKVDVDYGYDFIRDDKHISDEELIERHGTKYYEFSYVNKQLTEEEKRGTDYSKKPEKPVIEPVKENKTLSSFFTTGEELKNEIMEEQVALDPVAPIEEDPVDILDEDSDFNIHLSIEDEDDEPYEYNSFDDRLPKPEPTPIHNYEYNYHESVTKAPEKPAPVKTPEPEEESIQIDEIHYETKEPISPQIEEEDVSLQEDFEVEYKETVAPKPEAPKPVEKPKKPKYDTYKIPYKKLFAVSDASLEEMPSWLEEKKEIINQQLQAFGIDGEVITYTKGPAFTRYEIMLAQNVNVKKINSIYDNIQMALKAKSMRIQAPIPGKNTVGVEVPNEKADMVAYGDILTDDYIASKKNLLIAMGMILMVHLFFKTSLICLMP